METVKVEALSSHIIKMTWEHHVKEKEVGAAFKKINDLLDQAEQPMFVLVDITAKPQFPLMTTVHSAIDGPYRNPRLREWLIVGSNRLAHIVEGTLASLTKRKNVRWFNTENDAKAYVDSAAVTD